MAFEELRGRYDRLLVSMGKKLLNALYPNDFEYYLVALELTDPLKNDETLEYFIFPITPESINFVSKEITNVKKTAGGVVSLSNPNFVPVDINISGSFGRKFKFLLGGSEFNFTALNLSGKQQTFKNSVFSSKIKTGYGCIKILENIINSHNKISESGGPLNLYFYNPALGHNFLVKSVTLNLSQRKENNMIWSYSLQLTGIAPINELVNSDPKSLTRNLSYDTVNKGINNLASEIKSGLKNKI